MNDLVLFFAIVVISSAAFLPLHVVAFRVWRTPKIVTTLSATIAVSALVGAAIGWWGLGSQFSSEGARLVACAGGALTFTGFAGVYGLIGPVSVDRSVSAHIVGLVYLAPKGHMDRHDLFKLYTHTDVLEKRFRDCIETGIIELDGNELVVTRRGARIALIYSILGNLLGLRLWYLDRYRSDAKLENDK